MSELTNVTTYLDGLCMRVAVTPDDDIQRSVEQALTDAAYSLSDLEDRKMAGHRGPFTVEIPEVALIWLVVGSMAATGYGKAATMTSPEPILRAIAGLTAALIAQDSASDITADARRRLIRQAVREGHTLTAIGDASGITRQRVAQLAGRGER